MNACTYSTLHVHEYDRCGIVISASASRVGGLDFDSRQWQVRRVWMWLCTIVSRGSPATDRPRVAVGRAGGGRRQTTPITKLIEAASYRHTEID